MLTVHFLTACCIGRSDLCGLGTGNGPNTSLLLDRYCRIVQMEIGNRMLARCFHHLLAVTVVLGQLVSAMAAHAHAGHSHLPEQTQPHVHFSQEVGHAHSHSHSHSRVAEDTSENHAAETAILPSDENHDDDAVYLNGKLSAVGAASPFTQCLSYAIPHCTYPKVSPARLLVASDLRPWSQCTIYSRAPLYLAVQSLRI